MLEIPKISVYILFGVFGIVYPLRGYPLRGLRVSNFVYIIFGVLTNTHLGYKRASQSAVCDDTLCNLSSCSWRFSV